MTHATANELAVGLNDRQRRFAFYFVELNNGAQAALRAGYSPRTAMFQASALLSVPKVADVVAALRHEREAASLVTAAGTVAELATIAFSDMANYAVWDETGVQVFPSDTLAPSHTAAIQSIRVKRKRRMAGDEAWEVEELEIKLHDKVGALDKLMKHTGAYEADNTQRPGLSFIDQRTQLLMPLAQLSDEQKWKLASIMLEGEAEPVDDVD